MQIFYYHALCPKCHFSAGLGKALTLGADTLTPLEQRALLLLAAHAGKIIWVYASLKGIESDDSEEVQQHPNFQKKEYLKLLAFYNNLKRKCDNIIQQSEEKATLEDLIGN